MASEQGETRQILIGAAIGPSIGSVFNTIENRLKHLEQRGSEVKLLRGSIEEARRLEAELEKVEDKGSRTAIGLQGSLDQVREKLKQQKVDVTRLGEAYKTLGRVAEGIEQQKAGMQLISEGKASIAQARTTFNGLMGPVKAAAGFDDKIVDIIAKAGEGGNAETLKASISSTASSVSKETRMSSSDVVNLIGTMQGEGMSLGDSVGQASVAAKFSASQGVDAKDTARLVSTLSDAGISSADMEKVLSRLAAQAKGSDVDISGVAQAMAKLLPSLGEGKSADDILRLGAMIQVKVGGAQSADDGIKELRASLKEGKGATPEAARAAMGDEKQADYDKLLKKGANGASSKDAKKTILDDDLTLRQTPGQNLKDASNAVEDLKRDFGAILLPSVGALASTFADATRGVNKLMNSSDTLVLSITAAVAVFSALGAAAGAFKIAKGVVDVGAGLFKQGSGAASARQPGSFAQRVGQMLSGGGGSSPDGGASAGSSGLPGNAAGPVDVFVVNLGGLIRGPFGTGGNQAGGTVSPGSPQPVVNAGEIPPANNPPGGNTSSTSNAGPEPRRKRTSRFSRVFSSLKSGAKAVAKRTPIGRVLDAGLSLADIFTSKASLGEKAAGVASVAGGAGGAWAGMAAGAAIGSVVPGIGTAVGGAIGLALGGSLGEGLVGWLGDSFLSRRKQQAPAPAQAQGPGSGSVQARPSPENGQSAQPSRQTGQQIMIEAEQRRQSRKNQNARRRMNARSANRAGNDRRIGATADANTVGQTARSGKSDNRMNTDPANNNALPPAAAGIQPGGGIAQPQQPISFAPNVSISIQGMIFDPPEVVRRLEAELQRLFNRMMRQTRGGELIDPAMP
ncbi:phage tail tape measure protein [Pseudomonas wadenswilerensis]